MTNSGTGPATGVTVNDTLPPAFTNPVTSGCTEGAAGTPVCTLGTIAGGASASYTITGTVSRSAPASITNTATLSAPGIPADGNDTATQQTTVSVAADLHIQKTIVTPLPIYQSQNAVFQLAVMNNGPSDATGVVVTDVLPAGLQFVDSGCATAVGSTVTWTIGALAFGGSTTCQFRVLATTTGSMTNTATVTGSSPADPGGPDSSSVTFVVGAAQNIPVASSTVLLIMAAFLALGGAWMLRR